MIVSRGGQPSSRQVSSDTITVAFSSRPNAAATCALISLVRSEDRGQREEKISMCSAFIDENALSFSLMSSVSMRPQTATAVSTKRPMLGQISVCNGCCCGQTQKGHSEVPVEWLKQEWKYRGLLKRVHLTITGCLGPCDVPNVVLITSVEGTQWLAEISQRRQYEMLADWAEQSKIADRLLPLPREFNTHRLAAYRDDGKGYK